MRHAALSLLACPRCAGDVALDDGARRDADGHVMTGALRCTMCHANFAIRDGVPRMLSDNVSVASSTTANRFGAQWKTFDHMATYQEERLRQWLEPIAPSDFRDKVVLEAGCGKGRHSVVVASWQARQLVALDLSEAVDVAFRHTRELSNVHVVQGDLLNAPVRRVFDVAFSVGVLHHLPSPRAGFEALKRVVVPGGLIAFWVYGYESNEWVVRYVNPIRERLTSRMAPSLLYWLSLPPAVGVSAASRAYRNDALARRLPYAGYLRWLSTLPFREVHNIVFDQLVTPIAHYLPESEIRAWLESGDMTAGSISSFRDNSWRGWARLAGSGNAAA